MKTYQAASTNVNKGYSTHGKFVSTAKGKGQKPGRKSLVGKEKTPKHSTDVVHAKLRKISKAMFQKPRTLNGQVSMRSQLNG